MVDIALIRETCEKVGLMPVEIRSMEQVGSLIHYLNKIGANSADSYGIPIGVDYTCEIECKEEIKSFNEPESPGITPFVKKFIETGRIQNQDFYVKGKTIDVYMLSYSHDKLQMQTLASSKVRGTILLFY